MVENPSCAEDARTDALEAAKTSFSEESHGSCKKSEVPGRRLSEGKESARGRSEAATDESDSYQNSRSISAVPSIFCENLFLSFHLNGKICAAILVMSADLVECVVKRGERRGKLTAKRV